MKQRQNSQKDELKYQFTAQDNTKYAVIQTTSFNKDKKKLITGLYIWYMLILIMHMKNLKIQNPSIEKQKKK